MALRPSAAGARDEPEVHVAWRSACHLDRAAPTARALARPAHRSILITTRRLVGRVTSLNPAAAKALRLPTWSSPEVIVFPGSVSIPYPSTAWAPCSRANST